MDKPEQQSGWSGGYVPPVEQFFVYWSKLYNEVPVDESREVYVIGFELV